LRLLCVIIFILFCIVFPWRKETLAQKTYMPSNVQGTTFLEEVKNNYNDFLYKERRNIHPYASYELEFDDNIFRTNDDKESDIISTYEIGVKYDFKPHPIEGRTRILSDLTFDVSGKIVRYAKHGNLNEDYIDRSLLGNISMNSTYFDRVDVYFNLRRDQRVAADLYPTARTAPTRASRERLVDYWTNSYGASYRIGPEVFTLVPAYDHYSIHYDNEEDKNDNYVRDSFSLTNYMKISPKTTLFIGGTYALAKYPKREDEEVNYIVYTAGGTHDFEFTPKIDGTATVSYTILDRERGNDRHGVTGELGLDYKFHPRLNFSFNASRTISDVADTFEERAKEPEQNIYIREGDYDVTSQFAVRDNASLSATYQPAIDKRLSVDGGLFYTNSEYDDGREIKTYGTNLGIRYEIKKWLYFIATYFFRKEDESDSEGYDNNIINLKLDARF